MGKQKTIVICSSANFYKHVDSIAGELEKMGYKIEVPITVKRMRKTDNYNADYYRTWQKNPDTYKRKTYLMKNHFNKIASSDAILVVNDEKRGIKGYIGANVLMEMGLAFHLKKPIFVLNGISTDVPAYEEMKGMNCRMINQDLSRIRL